MSTTVRVFGDDFACRRCSECGDKDGASIVLGGHHWLEQSLDLNSLDDDEFEELFAGPIFAGVDTFMSCKHCPAWTPDWETVLDYEGDDA